MAVAAATARGAAQCMGARTRAWKRRVLRTHNWVGGGSAEQRRRAPTPEVRPRASCIDASRGEIKITEAFLGIRENYSIIGLLLSVIFICLAVFDELFFRVPQ